GMSHDGNTIVVLDGGWSSAVRVVVWNAATGKRIGRPEGHDGTVTCIAYAPDGKSLVSGSIDRTVRLWETATGEHRRVLAVHKGAVTAIAISPDGRLVASSSQAGVALGSRSGDGKTVAEGTGRAKGARALAFSQDGRVLFTAGDSHEVLGREITGGKEVVRRKLGDDGEVMAIGGGGAMALTANTEVRFDATRAC